MSGFQLVPYKAEHVWPMLDQEINAGIRGSYKSTFAKILETQGTSMTVLVKDQPMVCGGAIEIWKGRACIWTVFNEQSKYCFLSAFRGIKAFLNLQMETYNRLELSVPVNFELGHRRAKLLGFKVECELAKAFLPDGTDCILYSLVKEKNNVF